MLSRGFTVQLVHSCMSRWSSEHGIPPEDRDSEIIVVVNGYMLVNSQNRLRQRTYHVGTHVRFGYRFAPIVKHPQQSRWEACNQMTVVLRVRLALACFTQGPQATGAVGAFP